MASVLLALDDVGLGVQLADTLEAAGHRVTWQGIDPTKPDDIQVKPALVILQADATSFTVAELAALWREVDPLPGMLVIGVDDAARRIAQEQRLPYVASTASDDELHAAVDQTIKMRYAAALSTDCGIRLLGMRPLHDRARDAVRIASAAGKADAYVVREALRWYAMHYVTVVDDDMIATLREHRALSVPALEVLCAITGASTLSTLVSAARDPVDVARTVWALTCAGAVEFTPAPRDMATTARRAVAMLRKHLVARAERLERCTFYDVLEVPTDATMGEIDRAARLCAIRFAPNRVGRLDLADHADMLEPAWAQILTARKCLTDTVQRGRYNEWLASHGYDVAARARGIDKVGAEEAFQRGQRALTEGQPFKAVSDLAMSARLWPDHADYEAYLCWARFRADVARGGDQHEIANRERDAAETLMLGRRPWARALLALGLLCAASQDGDAARWHLREALECEPDLAAAHHVLQRLGG